MVAATLLPAPAAGLALDQLQAEEQRIVVALATTTPEAPCPLCGQSATRVQSHYYRHLAVMWTNVKAHRGPPLPRPGAPARGRGSTGWRLTA